MDVKNVYVQRLLAGAAKNRAHSDSDLLFNQFMTLHFPSLTVTQPNDADLFVRHSPSTWFLIKYGRQIIAEEKNASFDVIEKKLLGYAREVSALNSAWLRVLQSGKFSVRKSWVRKSLLEENTFDNFMRFAELAQVSPKDLLHSFRRFVKLAPVWLRAKDSVVNGLRVRTILFPHNEAPLAIEILSPQGKRVGIIGGYILSKGKGRQLYITCVQGEKQGLQKNAAQSQTHAKINAELGENWRVFFTKKVCEYGAIRNIEVVGALPRYLGFDTPHSYKKRWRLYDQTYRKSGFVKDSNLSWKFVPKAGKVKQFNRGK